MLLPFFQLIPGKEFQEFFQHFYFFSNIFSIFVISYFGLRYAFCIALFTFYLRLLLEVEDGKLTTTKEISAKRKFGYVPLCEYYIY